LIPDFAEKVITWHDRAGRKDLPWQVDPTPYRVWVSEIMLQQTQVGTVIGYFDRFMERFPDVVSLAAASLDEVLHLWSGLGYYARARNLHRAARLIRDEYVGRFPEDLASVQALPGVGRSTAGAILTLACGQSHPILDGNVKRVLARVFAVEGWAGAGTVLKRLWALAEELMPTQRPAAYTQGMMDLGATLCARAAPRCCECPLAGDCKAYRQGRVTEFPRPRPRRENPVRRVQMLILVDDAARVLLERRPPAGVWGGLWSLPECPETESPTTWVRQHLGLEADLVEIRPVRRHTFTHFRLDMIPVHLRASMGKKGVAEDPDVAWYDLRAPENLGLAAPVAAIIREVTIYQRSSP
jgi:A/G-specific adenine glycosylase